MALATKLTPTTSRMLAIFATETVFMIFTLITSKLIFRLDSVDA